MADEACRSGSRFADFLAPPLVQGEEVFTFREGHRWVVFYAEAPRRGTLPRVLDEPTITGLARELAAFHRDTTSVAAEIDPSWQTVGSGLAQLYDRMRSGESGVGEEW